MKKKSNLLQDLSLSVSRILASRLNDIYSLIIYKSKKMKLELS